MRKIRVLVVDDSRMFREVLTDGINSDPSLEVVAAAADVYEARDAIIK
jgi:two-component system chemotaxis response regulator CheB